MKLATSLLASAAVLALSGTAQAAHFKGWYVGLEGGVSWVEDVEVVVSTGLYSSRGEAEFDSGWAVMATVGYAFANNWRIEGEVGYRSNKVESFTSGYFGSHTFEDTRYGTGADLNELTLMANVIRDFQLTDKLALAIGAGVGADRVELDAGADFSDDEWTFAYQGIAGLSYAVTNRMDLTLNYRYLRVKGVNLEDPTLLGGPPEMLHLEVGDLTKHAVTIGLRYDLHEDEAEVVVPPPLPPAPAVKQFIVFFGFNKCNITSEADAVLSEAAASAKSTGSASIVIVGHTDTVGSPAYNQKLSECRANAAKSNLEGKGIAAGSISASGKGETELMVQTGDGVKEPQNRRATIDLQ